MTEKDRRLLIFLAVFLLIAGFGWFLIRPAINAIGDLNTSIAYAETTKKQNEYSISRIPELQQQLSDAAAQLKTDSSDFYGQMESQKIDSLLTLEALSSGFQQSDLRELTISSPTDYAVILPYLSTEDTASAAPFSGIYAADVSFKLHGSRAALEAFLDKVTDDFGSIQVTGFTWEDDRTESDTAGYLLTLSLRVYMTDAEATQASAGALTQADS